MSNQTNQNKTSTEGNREKGKPWLYFLGFLLLCWILSTSMVIVSETESVIVERLGQIVAIYDQPDDKGLHGKFPWPIDTVRTFDDRIQIYDPPGREFFTKDKKNIVVDTYLCWKIAEAAPESDSSEAPVLKFFRSYGNPEVAEARLDSRLRSIVSTQLGKIDLSELLNAPSSDTAPESKPESQLDQLSSLLLKEMRENDSRSLSAQSGIEIVDVRIKRINLPYGNQQAVYERMKSERKKIADRYRSAGLAENRMIRSQADRYYNEFIAKAEAESEKIKGDAEAKAVEIVNKAHARDPEFYQLLQTLDSYEKIINEKTSLYLSAQSPLLKIFSNGVELKEKTKKETENSEPETSREKQTEESPPEETPPQGGDIMRKLALGLIFLLAYLATGFFTVGGNELAVVERFGKLVTLETNSPRIYTSGLHYDAPWPWAKTMKFNLNEIRTIQIGIPYSIDQGSQGSEEELSIFIDSEAYNPSRFLTGDKNILDIQITVQYRLAEDQLVSYLFGNINPEYELKILTESIATDLMSRCGVDFIHPSGLTELQNLITIKTRQKSNELKLGFDIDTVTIDSVMPPQQVKAWFLDVSNARADKEKQINSAKNYLARKEEAAKADYQQVIDEAVTYKNREIEKAKGNASRFNQLIDQFDSSGESGYAQSRLLTSRRLYLETMKRIYETVKVQVLIGTDQPANLMLFPETNVSIPPEK